jgi:hypothetical protein
MPAAKSCLTVCSVPTPGVPAFLLDLLASRFGKDVGRSVAATGYWANILDPPYTSFGISTDDPALLKQTNKQFSHSSVDVAEHNLLVGGRQWECSVAPGVWCWAAGVEGWGMLGVGGSWGGEMVLLGGWGIAWQRVNPPSGARWPGGDQVWVPQLRRTVMFLPQVHNEVLGVARFDYALLWVALSGSPGPHHMMLLQPGHMWRSSRDRRVPVHSLSPPALVKARY